MSYAFNNVGQLLFSVTRSFTLLWEHSLLAVQINVCGSRTEMEGETVQLAGRYGQGEAISSQLSPPYHGRQLALWSAPWLLHTEKENGAETKSSAPILPLSAPKFAVIARIYSQTEACKINTMPGPFEIAKQIKKPRMASVQFRPSFWTIAAREWRRRDLVSGTPFLSFKN